MGHMVTFGEFQYWLLGKDEDEVIAKTNSLTDCPISKFVKETKLVKETSLDVMYTTVEPDSMVGDGEYKGASVSYLRRGKHYEQRIPKWAVRLMHRIDTLYSTNEQGIYVCKDITAGEVLDILREVKHGTA